jgi:hypothetical protein
MLQILVDISLKVLLQKRDKGLYKSLRKREKSEKNEHKSVQDIENNGYLDARLEKKRIKIAPVLLQKIFSSFKREICFQGA